MEWHIDDPLYDPEQIEIVLTIENNSDCVTKWDLSKNDDNNIHHNQSTNVNIMNNNNIINDNNNHNLIEVETEPNSAIILKAGSKYGVPHFVSSLKSGKRVILKFVFVQEDAIFIDGAMSHTNQFSSSSSSSSSTKKKKQKRKNQGKKHNNNNKK